jgi:hypothetical protein
MSTCGNLAPRGTIAGMLGLWCRHDAAHLGDHGDGPFRWPRVGAVLLRDPFVPSVVMDPLPTAVAGRARSNR